MSQSHSRSHDADPYAAWRLPNFRYYAASWFLLSFAAQVGTVAVGVHLYDKTHSAMALAIIGLVQALPVIMLALAGGHLADRFDRRHVLMLSLGTGFLVSLGLAAASWMNASPHWFYLLLALAAASRAIGSPARASLLPLIVEPQMFSKAVTWSTSMFQLSLMVGPIVGGVLVWWDPTATCAFLVVAICRILSFVSVAMIRCKPTHVRTNESVTLRSLLAGIHFVRSQKVILAAITLDLFAVLLGGLTYLLPMFTKDVLKLEWHEAAVGLFRSFEAIGAISMAVFIAHAPPMRRAGKLLLCAVAGFGLVTIVFGLSTSFWLSLAMMFFIGAMDNVSVVVRHTLVQMLTPDSMRGRVSAINNIFIVTSNDLGGFESGLTAWLFGPVLSVVGGGIGTILVVLGAARLFPQLRAVDSLRDLQPVEEEEKMLESVR